MAEVNEERYSSCVCADSIIVCWMSGGVRDGADASVATNAGAGTPIVSNASVSAPALPTPNVSGLSNVSKNIRLR
ncbi:MAG: hypothetical protein ACP5IG_02545 [Candidatus Micrarchaeia archaeon]